VAKQQPPTTLPPPTTPTLSHAAIMRRAVQLTAAADARRAQYFLEQAIAATPSSPSKARELLTSANIFLLDAIDTIEKGN